MSIKHPEAEKLAKALAAKTGETITQTVIKALRDQLTREEGRRVPLRLKDELIEISQRCAALPDVDNRPADDILGYDQQGLPGKPHGH